MRFLLVIVLLSLSACATKFAAATNYVDTAVERPNFPRPAPGSRYSFVVRDLSGKIISRLISGTYCYAAYSLANTPRTKIESTSTRPRGTGYILELVEDDRSIDWFVFWPDEVVVHGQRWRIDQEGLARQMRMHWFSEFDRTK